MIESPDSRSSRVRAALSLLTPHDIAGFGKVRFGRDMDGGYVLVAGSTLPPVFYSFGVGHETSFETALAARGCRGYLFDHTVEQLPRPDPNLHFSKQGLGGVVDPDGTVAPIGFYVERNGDGDRTDMLLKVDVEGCEYAAITAADDATLRQFRQIALEVHDLHRLADPAFCEMFRAMFEKLNASFTLCHVHANNCAPFGLVEGHPVADVLELTYIRTDLVSPLPSRTRYPTHLDRPNDPGRPDVSLLFFPFHPQPVAAEPAAVRPLKILYLACHETLEYDDMRMFTEMGHRVFSVGGLANPDSYKPATRPVMERFYSRDWWTAFSQDPGCDLKAKKVTRAFADLFDLIIVNHDSMLLDVNQDALRDRPVIFRSVGQSNHHLETVLSRHLDAVRVVRYSHKEIGLADFCPADRVIYFAKFLSDYPSWQPGQRIVTFHNGFPTRGMASVPTLDQYNAMAESGHLDLYGFLNDGLKAWRGLASPDHQLDLFRTASIYMYVYSLAASYTLSFIEAMLVGVPIIAPSAAAVRTYLGPVAPAYGFSDIRYEVADLLDHDPMLIWDRFEDIPIKIRDLLYNPDQAGAISQRLRAKAAAMFDVRVIAPQWQELFLEVV